MPQPSPRLFRPAPLLLVALILLTVGVIAQGQAPATTAKAPQATTAAPQPAPAPAAKAPPIAAKTRPSAATAPAGDVTSPYEAALANLKWREIGPAAMGGRIDDFAVVESNPSVFYVGAASGGIFRTVNSGTTFTPIFDKEEVSTIGDLAIAASDPSIIWAGTGEPNNRQSSSWGNGIYKSTDGGETWRHMGLRETHHIARVLVHPTNPDVVYVAALGRLWGPNKERGVYKTTDGGATWKQVLFISEDTGITDLAMDPDSPEILYAAAYQRRRTVFGFAGSGPEGGIHKSTDGGATWKKLVAGLPWDPSPPAPRRGGDGMPPEVAAMLGITLPQQPEAVDARPKMPERQEIGRIGLAVYLRDPRIVYALVEHANGGIFRSEDRGETWRKMSETNPRPMYYSKVRIDPNNDQRLWVHGAQMFTSEDGGKTFATDVVTRIHGDYHAMWINPANSNHMLVGSDGGIHISWDRGRTWSFLNTVPLGQFYEISADMEQPYRICGGLQDNNTWCGPSASLNPRGIGNDDWFTIGGGDGFYAQLDPNDPTVVYAESQDGNVLRRDLRTGEQRRIKPEPPEGAPPYRFQWNSPIVISRHDKTTIYYGGNFVFKSTDRGDSWTTISLDLTSGVDRNTLPIMGRVPDRTTRSRHDGVVHYGTITTISESPFTADLIWVGTDDGNLQVTRDGGKTWKNVADRATGVPKGTYVSRVIASSHAEGTAYATFDGHRSNEFGIYVYATTDYGETWKKITTGIPNNNGIINVIREHPKNPDLLFAGGEYGAYVTFDRGANWMRLKGNLPTVPVDDIFIHPRDNDLIFGTHGRSIWILDDITPLSELNDKVLASDVHVFTTRPGVQWRTWPNTGSTGHQAFFGENPPQGVIINYYLKNKPAEGQRVRITVEDKSGKVVRSMDGTGNAGLNRVAWDTRMDSPIPPAPPGQGGPGGGGGFGGFFGAAGGPRVDPGDYTIKVKVGDSEVTKLTQVQDDPRITVSAADRAARWEVLDRMMPKVGPMVVAQRSIQQMRTNVNNAIESWKRPNAPKVPENVTKAAEALLKKIDDLYPNFGTPPSEQRGLGDAGAPLVVRPSPYSQRMTQFYGDISNQTGPPTAWQKEQANILLGKADELVASVRNLGEGLTALNKLMNEAGVPHIAMPTAGGARRGPQ